MKRIQAFLLGMYEFRLTFTQYYGSWHLARAYDAGREFAHRITLRRFET